MFRVWERVTHLRRRGDYGGEGAAGYGAGQAARGGRALSHAELVDLVLRQYAELERMRAALAEAEALIARLEARVRELETPLGLRSSGKGTVGDLVRLEAL